MNAHAIDLINENGDPPPPTFPTGWLAADITPEDWLIRLDQAGLDEIAGLLRRLRAAPLPVILRDVADFDLPELTATMARAKAILDNGCGFAVVDRLPMDDHDIDDMVAVFWLVGQLIARPVAQKWDGTMIYDVTDTGRPFGYGVRGSTTAIELRFHVDNAFGRAVPDYVGLLCKHPARRGGVSRFCSLYTLYRRIGEADADLLARLHEPMLFDRQNEHAPGVAKVARAAFFAWRDGRLRARANTGLVRAGYRVAGLDMDTRLAAALALVDEISNDPDLWYEAAIERGQMQYLNNHELGHYRSAFSDDGETETKRHLYRTWHRDWGLRTYDGV